MLQFKANQNFSSLDVTRIFVRVPIFRRRVSITVTCSGAIPSASKEGLTFRQSALPLAVPGRKGGYILFLYEYVEEALTIKCNCHFNASPL